MSELISSDGVRLVYDDLGPREGTPVVLCHGLAAAGEQMRADADYFAALGYRVLLPDLRGHGRSGKPTTMRPEDFSIARIAADLIEMLDHAGVAPVHWVGNSLGGIVALQMVKEHEARFRTLATFGTSYSLNLPRWSGNVLRLGYSAMGASLAGRLTAWQTTRNAAARPIIERLIRQFDPLVGQLVANNVSDYNLIANLDGKTLPILMLRGGHDRAVNSALGPTLKAMRGRPNFTLVEVPEGGHCANLDATDAWRAALLSFWRGK